MRVYFDTEFNGFREGSLILSIGLVDDDSRACYVELPPHSEHFDGAADFVLTVVRGQFGRLPHCQCLTAADMGLRVSGYLRKRLRSAKPLELHFDYKLDWQHLTRLLHLAGDAALLDHLRPVDAAGWMTQPEAQVAADATLAHCKSLGFEEHHALVDALAMRSGHTRIPLTQSSLSDLVER